MSVPCPFCGAHAETRETRTTKSGTVTRAKVCQRGHKFSTQETVYATRFGRLCNPATVYKPHHSLTQLDRRASVKAALLARDGRTLTQIGMDCDVSPRTVKRIQSALSQAGELS